MYIALMTAMHERLPRTCESLKKDDAGLTTVEYIIILALIAIAAIGAWNVFGGSIETQARGSSTTIGGLPR